MKKQPNKATLQAMRELEDGKGHKASSTTELFNDLDVKLGLPSGPKPRIAGLNNGQTVMSDDFDEPLDNDFWLGKP